MVSSCIIFTLFVLSWFRLLLLITLGFLSSIFSFTSLTLLLQDLTESIVRGIKISTLLERDLEHRGRSCTSLDPDNLTVLVVDKSSHNIGELDNSFLTIAMKLNCLMQVVV